MSILDDLIKANNGSAVFRPSSGPRWLKCTGSVLLSAKVPGLPRSSAYAKEGTAAHHVFEDALKGVRQPEEWIDRAIRSDDDSDGWIVDDEMAGFVEEVVDFVDLLRTEKPGITTWSEQKMSLGLANPADRLLNECRGTADCVLVDPTQRKLTIVDLKYGRGVMVAADSLQLRLYALMALLAFAGDTRIDIVEAIIAQPRAVSEKEQYKSALYAPSELLGEFLPFVNEKMEECLVPEQPLVVGDHCRWCPAEHICPAKRAQALSIAANMFGSIEDAVPVTALTPLPPMPVVSVGRNPDTPKDALVLPASVDLDPGEIATILARAPIMETWIESIRHRAAQLISVGTKVPGWKLVSRSGHRRFKDQVEAVKTLAAQGVSEKDMYVAPKLKSPKQMEGLLPKAKRVIIDALVERPVGAPTLVADSDARPEVPALLGPIED